MTKTTAKDHSRRAPLARQRQGAQLAQPGLTEGMACTTSVLARTDRSKQLDSAMARSRLHNFGGLD
jgi:hypothetical protein